MTSKPFLTRYDVWQVQHDDATTTYDPQLMVLMLEGKPAVYEPTYEDRARTRITETQRETSDDQ